MPGEIKAEYRSHKTKKGKEIEAIYLDGNLWRHLSGYPKARRASASHIMELREYYGFYLWLIQIAPDTGEDEGVIEIPLKALEQLLPYGASWIRIALRWLHNHPKTYILFYPAVNQHDPMVKIIIPKYSHRTWQKFQSLVEEKQEYAEWTRIHKKAGRMRVNQTSAKVQCTQAPSAKHPDNASSAKVQCTQAPSAKHPDNASSAQVQCTHAKKATCCNSTENDHTAQIKDQEVPEGKQEGAKSAWVKSIQAAGEKHPGTSSAWVKSTQATPETPCQSSLGGALKPLILKPYLSLIHTQEKKLSPSEAILCVSKSMGEVIEYFFSKTGKESIELQDPDFIHLLEQKHTPSVIQEQINVTVELFKEQGQDPKDITLWCIWNALRDQRNTTQGVDTQETKSKAQTVDDNQTAGDAQTLGDNNQTESDDQTCGEIQTTIPVNRPNETKEPLSSPSSEVSPTTQGIPSATPGVPSSSPKPDSKKATKREDGQNEAIIQIFTHWNSKEIIRHREIERFKSHIRARLKTYSLAEIIQAIDNYDQILKSPDYYWSHKFDLDKFLKPGNIDRFLSENNPFDNFKAKGFQTNQRDQTNQTGQTGQASRNSSGSKYNQNAYKYCNKPDIEYLRGTKYDPSLNKEQKEEKEKNEDKAH